MKLLVEGQPLEVSAPEPSEQTRPIDLLPVLYEVVAAVSESVAHTSASEGRPVRCGPGCGACCRQVVPVGPAEAERLRGVVEAMPAEQQQRVRARFDDARRRLEAAGVGRAGRPEERNDALELRADQAEWVKLSLDYFRAQVPCPFLVDESCSIHPQRPVACREHLVTSDPRRCGEPKMNRVTSVGLTGRFFAALEAIDRAPGAPFEWVALPFALGWTPRRPVPPSKGLELLDALLAAMPFETKRG